MSTLKSISSAQRITRLDFAPTSRAPSALRIVLGTGACVGGSLGIDALLVRIGTWIYPSVRGYVHFHFSDYATLTVIGVVIATFSWPIVVRISSAPRWIYARFAVLITLVLWLPDVYLLVRNAPPRAVGILMVMHLGIALVTYNLIIRLAPPRAIDDDSDASIRQRALPAESSAGSGQPISDRATKPRLAATQSPWITMMIAVGVEFCVGIVVLLLVPTSRPSAFIPLQGKAAYLLHAVLGAVIFIGSTGLVLSARAVGRRATVGAVVGLVGIVISAGGGLLAADHALRLLGMALMFVGSCVAFFGYLMPLVEGTGSEEPSSIG